MALQQLFGSQVICGIYKVGSSFPPSCQNYMKKGIFPEISLVAVKNSTAMFHSSSLNYGMTKHITMPENIEDIDAAEKSQFSPQRSRDISGPVILSKTMGTFVNNQFATSFNSRSRPSDPRLGIYDCRGPISLHSAMQTNVPEPFSAKGKAMHLNMPGGQWGQGHKYISDDLQNFHFRNLAQQYTSGTYFMNQKLPSLILLRGRVQLQSRVSFSTSPDKTNNFKQVSNKEKLKLLVRDYGSTVIIFHVGISLLSLGGCYLIVASGISLEKIESFFKTFGIEGIAQKGGTFVIAYAIHKVFAPIRLGITASVSPFIVRYLRRRGILKQPATSTSCKN